MNTVSSAAAADGRTVALVDVQIDHQGSADELLALQRANCDRHIGVDTEPFALVGLGVVVASAKVDRHAVFQCQSRGQDRATRGMTKRAEHPAVQHRGGQRADHRRFEILRHPLRVLELFEVLRRMDQQNLLAVERLGYVEILAADQAVLDQLPADLRIFMDVERMEAFQPAKVDFVLL